jgi:hypothetical protein
MLDLGVGQATSARTMRIRREMSSARQHTHVPAS